MKHKIIIVVEGGVVCSVYANLAEVEVEVDVIDCDDLEAEGNSGEWITNLVDAEVEGMAVLL